MSCLGLLVLAGTAHAQRAPIVYAGQGAAAPAPVQTADARDRLEGGSENSYGYGSANRGRSGAVIDLRRPASGAARVTPVVAQQETPLPVDETEGDSDEHPGSEQIDRGQDFDSRGHRLASDG